MAGKKLVCVDSDGCAFDSMEAKHKKCFGPQVLTVWPLEERREEVLATWDRVNLYAGTRAVNRFIGLALVLKDLGEKDWEAIWDWTKRAPALSNDVLEKEEDPALKRALEWSLAVNRAIARMPPSGPFPGAKEALIQASKEADIVVVSSTNPAALKKEWERAGLMPYVTRIMSHQDGPKKECIAKMLAEGYAKEDTVMLGDAPGDLQAALDNGVHFYPICPRRESEDWEKFEKTVLPLFVAGEYKGEVEEGYIREFMERFEGKT